MTTDPLLTTSAVARELGIDVRTLYRMLRDGKLSCVHLGHRTKRIRRSALDQYLRDRESGACS